MSMNQNVLNMLKIYYKDKVENLLFRNSPVFSKIGKERIEGKSANFAALAGFSGGVGGDYAKALEYASEVGACAQWEVTPGQVFGVVSFNNKEVQASASNKGAFIRTADAKMFTSFDAVKKVLATALYGRGYGEVCASGYTTAITAGTAFQIANLPEFAMMTFVPGMKLALKSSITSSVVLCTLTVTAANGTTITVISDKTVASSALKATDILCVANSMDASGNPLLPMGLAGWIPNVHGRKDTGSGTNEWSDYVARSFMGVVRNVNQDALCGAYVPVPATAENKDVTVKKLIRKLRRQGSKADLIVLNDEDFESMSSTIATTDTYFTQTSGKAKRTINTGVAEMTAAFSTNFIENVYDDPFCPKGRFYVLDSDTVKFWSYSNADKVMDVGVAGNEAGTKDVEEGSDIAAKPYQLLIDDILSLQPGTAGTDGPSTVVGINVYASFVVTNTAHNGVGNFYGASDIQLLAVA